MRHCVAPKISRRKKKISPKSCNLVRFIRKQQKSILYFVNVFLAFDWTFCYGYGTITLGKKTKKAHARAEGRTEGEREKEEELLAKMRKSGLTEEQISAILNS